MNQFSTSDYHPEDCIPVFDRICQRLPRGISIRDLFDRPIARLSEALVRRLQDANRRPSRYDRPLRVRFEDFALLAALVLKLLEFLEKELRRRTH